MIVMKFGGTSVGSGQRIRAVHDICAAGIEERPVVVVSAVKGVTDLLLRAAEEAALCGKDPRAHFQQIAQIHAGICDDLQVPSSEIKNLLDECQSLLQGLHLLRELTLRTRDAVASYGERLSARITASYFRLRGLSAKAYDAWDVGMLTSSEFTQAKPLVEAEARMKQAFSMLPESEIPVVTGFIGKDQHGQVTTLGRGGSDYSAALIGAALRVKEIQIWTDVSGIMTGDPRVVPHARILPAVSFDEAAELAYFGAKVLHPRTIEPAITTGIPVLVKNSFFPEDPGTTILPGTEVKEGAVKAITSKKGITCLNLRSTRMLEAPGFLHSVFSVFHSHGLSIDVISTSEVSVSLTLDNAENLEEAMKELGDIAQVSVEQGRSIICLVGEGIKTTLGVAGRIFTVLGKEEINVEMISQGASRINITFVVSDHDADRAVRCLHDEFFS
ncbi:MAG: lysine-sensitive aspartokinase 3 [Armatimonadetes bacterium]|nr:lysine-sensitive aspartokinase 3 [Armatimonadota bacterium]